MTEDMVRHLSRELSLLRVETVEIGVMLRDHVIPALSHIADRGVRNELRIDALEVAVNRPPDRPPWFFPWRLFAVAVSAACLALAGHSVLGL